MRPLSERYPTLESAHARISELEDQVAVLVREVQGLRAEVSDLRAQVKRNSSNSSRPPSQDAPWNKPSGGSPKEPSGRKAGGQPGHPGKTRAVADPASADRIERVDPTCCKGCGGRLEPGQARQKPGWVHTVFEIPAIQVESTRYDMQACCCPSCGIWTKAALPTGVPRGIVGPNLQALIAYASGKLRVSRRNLRDFLAAMGLSLSLGTLQSILEGMSEALEGPCQEVLAHVQASPVLHGDETGYGRNRLGRWWLWAASSLSGVAFRLAAGRGKDQLAELIPLTYDGVLNRDRWKPYEHLTQANHQLCHAHLRRTFQGMIDRGGKATPVGQWLRDENTRMFSLWHRFKRGEMSRDALWNALWPLRMRMKRCLMRVQADADADRKAKALSRDLLRQWDHLWTFAAVEGVEPTNNEAERVLRPAVLWRKGSFGVQSLSGARWVERILTVLATAAKRQTPVLAYLRSVSMARLHGFRSPSLITT